MKKLAKAIFAPTFLVLLAASLSGCGSDSRLTIHVLNCEDYIGSDPVEYDLNGDGEIGEDETYDGVVAAFEAYESKKLGKEVGVIYDTYDTNETMLSSLKTGRSSYDLICASDYAIQKMMSQDMLQPFPVGEDGDYTDALANYKAYCPSYLQTTMKGILGTVKNDDGSETTGSLYRYSVGYMWGTLGVLYNPEKVSADKNISEDQIKYDLSSWSSLWDGKYQGEMSIKDSMRDTYAVGIMKTFDSEIKEDLAASGYFDGGYNLIDGNYEAAVANYNPKITEIFNRCDQESVNKVQDELLALKSNVFGFEVDSGKDDIVKGLIGMNLAWSGDAVYSMDTAEDENGKIIYYSIPSTGGNIWFDAWTLPKNAENPEIAVDFANFLSDPEIASANMDNIGYTPFIGGDTILDLVRDWYDPRTPFISPEEGAKLPYDMTGSTYEAAVVDGTSMSWADFEAKYNSEQAGSEEFEELAWSTVDLTYMFEGTLTLEDEEGNPLYPDIATSKVPDENPYIFYSDEMEEIADPSGAGEDIVAGRQFFAQYPDQNLIPKLAVMKDYGYNNKYVLSLWENVKSNNLPIWAVLTFGIIIAAALLGVGVSFFLKRRYKKMQIKRRKEIARKP